MSLDLKVMEELEAKAPEITTGFVIPIQFGGFGDAKVDFYVVEDFFLPGTRSTACAGDWT